MNTRTFELRVDAGAMPCYEATPGPTPGSGRGAVIVLQEAFGVNPHIENVVRRFAEAGYHGIAPHLFHRTGSPTLDYDDLSEVMPHLQALGDQGMLADVDAVLAHLGDAGWALDQIGAVGFCMGGRTSFLVAGSRPLGAAVGFYGGGIVTGRSEAMGPLLDLIPTMTTPWLGLFGDADSSIPTDDVERLRAELADHGSVDAEVVLYPGAGHGFHCDARPSYQAAAAVDGWNRTLAWLGDHLAPRHG